jgi:hypothetical protein
VSSPSITRFLRLFKGQGLLKRNDQRGIDQEISNIGEIYEVSSIRAFYFYQEIIVGREIAGPCLGESFISS